MAVRHMPTLYNYFECEKQAADPARWLDRDLITLALGSSNATPKFSTLCQQVLACRVHRAVTYNWLVVSNPVRILESGECPITGHWQAVQPRHEARSHRQPLSEASPYSDVCANSRIARASVSPDGGRRYEIPLCTVTNHISTVNSESAKKKRRGYRLRCHHAKCQIQSRKLFRSHLLLSIPVLPLRLDSWDLSLFPMLRPFGC